jgi:Flp pilus assembly protein TadG
MADEKNAPEKRRRNLFGVFIKDRTGATAVEFALVATPFLALVVALIQTFLVFFAQSILENTVRQAARQILTGQTQTQDAGLSATAAANAFKNQVCGYGAVLFSCNANLMVDVRVASNWASTNTGMPTLTYDANGNVNNLQFNPGNAGDIVVVRVMYLWPVFLGPLGFNLSNQPNNTRMLLASAAFQNEPAAP